MCTHLRIGISACVYVSMCMCVRVLINYKPIYMCIILYKITTKQSIQIQPNFKTKHWAILVDWMTNTKLHMPGLKYSGTTHLGACIQFQWTSLEQFSRLVWLRKWADMCNKPSMENISHGICNGLPPFTPSPLYRVTISLKWRCRVTALLTVAFSFNVL